jgi:hypothetical protein
METYTHKDNQAGDNVVSIDSACTRDIRYQKFVNIYLSNVLIVRL